MTDGPSILAYSFDEEGLYQGVTAAYRDPSTPTAAYLLPAHATLTPPPAPADHEAPVWTGDAWILMPDWRGWTGYAGDGTKVVITDIGREPDPAWSPDLPAAIAVERARSDRLAALSAACGTAIAGTFASAALGDMHVYPAAMTDQANMAQAAACGGGALWCADRAGTWRYLSHTADQAMAVLRAFQWSREACQIRLATLSARVRAADGVDAIAAVTWAVADTAPGPDRPSPDDALTAMPAALDKLAAAQALAATVRAAATTDP